MIAKASHKIRRAFSPQPQLFLLVNGPATDCTGPPADFTHTSAATVGFFWNRLNVCSMIAATVSSVTCHVNLRALGVLWHVER